MARSLQARIRHSRRPLTRPELTLYTRPYCALCAAAESVVNEAISLFKRNSFLLTRIDIDRGMENKRRYVRFTNDVPVLVFPDGAEMKHRIDVDALVERMRELMREQGDAISNGVIKK